ncbi:hypothetical protein VDG1235_4201 [Verrucomicrobiia bacterium DG1235]|nr:hypothetical protein VDG1235_4201 [Verrucomicrobiae bacterium DG1235]
MIRPDAAPASRIHHSLFTTLNSPAPLAHGGVPDSTFSWIVWLHVEDDGWPRKSLHQKHKWHTRRNASSCLI